MNTLKGILIMVAIFAACVIVSVYDPVNLNPNGLNGEGWTVELYFVPVFGFIIYALIKARK